MCLSIIKRTTVLKKDTKVYKAVVEKEGLEYPYGLWSEYTSTGLNRWTRGNPLFPIVGTTHATPVRISISYTTKYTSGFHCSRRAKHAVGFALACDWTDFVVKSYIIPKGTEVIIGMQDGFEVIVTPVLVNPRTAVAADTQASNN
jgi:hypothetical protein